MSPTRLCTYFICEWDMTLTCSSLAGDIEVLSCGSFCVTGDVQMKGAMFAQFY